MAVQGKNFTQLTSISSLDGGEILLCLDNDGVNKTFKASTLKKYIGNDGEPQEYILMQDDQGVNYRVYIKNNKLVSIKEEAFTATAPSDGDNTLYDGLIINQMYGGGTALEGTPVSHGFIELYNFTNNEINLKGIYLWYRAKAGSWQSLALEGIVPPRHSFLIRCAQHAKPYSAGVRCNVINYDMSWNIRLSDKGFSCYLQIGADTPEDNPVRQTKDAQGTVTSTNGKYIDLLGAGGVAEEDTIWAYETRYLHCMDKNTGVRRMDFNNSDTKLVTAMGLGNNGSTKGFNDIDCVPVDWKTCNVDIYRPRCLKDGRWTEYFDKPKQKETIPSMINVMFGENGDNTRTFTFQTPLTDSGFVKIRKDGEVKWKTYETTTEIFSNVDGDVTVHRCIIKDLEVGKYEYIVGTEGCSSDAYTFEVKVYNESTPMRILWTSDQQSWSKREYDVWQMAARFLNKKASLFDWHLNTGDISQNANRSNNAPYVK